jgi:hypothetical protein
MLVSAVFAEGFAAAAAKPGWSAVALSYNDLPNRRERGPRERPVSKLLFDVTIHDMMLHRVLREC